MNRHTLFPMLLPTVSHEEKERLRELHALAVLDSENDPLFDDIVKLSSHIMNCPISLISLVDLNRQWFKARVGVDVTETPRDISFCAHAIRQEETLVVEDALCDTRFQENPLVTKDPNIRFYAGHPLTTSNGFRLGTLCVIDRSAKKLSESQLDMLRRLARQASSLLERRRNERELESIRHNSRSLFEKIPAVVISMKGKDHTLDYMSSASNALFGKDDSTGKPLLQIQPQAKDSGLLALLDDVFHRQQTHALRNSTFLVDGQRRHFDFVFTPSLGIRGEVDGVMGVFEDITERILLEESHERLRQEQTAKYQKLAELVESLPMAIALLEGEGNHFVFANALFRQTFLHTTHFVGKRILDVIVATDYLRVRELLLRVQDTSETVSTTETVLQRGIGDDTHNVYFDFVFQPSRNDKGSVTGILMAALDVSSQVRARQEISNKVEELHQEKEVRERFVTALSHDLRTPLTAAKMNAQLLRRKMDSAEDVQKLSQRIISNVDRGEHMVRDLLDANRLKAGEGLPINLERCSPTQIIEHILSDIRTTRGRGVVVKGDLFDLEVYWDAEAIRRVLENLTTNAVKYGAPNTPITIDAKHDDDVVKLSVHNEGPAIAKDDQTTLFESYRRTDSAIAGGQKGWGIGLALVKGITEAHRGQVGIHSEEGSGTTFSISLPVDPRGEL